MRRAAKRDGNEHTIVRALRKAGCRVMFGSPNPDLIVQRGRTTYLLEVKQRKGGKLTASQEKMLADGWHFHIVRSEDEALEAVGLKASEREAV